MSLSAFVLAACSFAALAWLAAVTCSEVKKEKKRRRRKKEPKINDNSTAKKKSEH